MADGATGGVLVLGDDMRIFLAIVRSLGRAGREVHAAPFDEHAPALRSKYIAKVHHVPNYSDDPQAWVDTLLSVLRENVIDLVVPCCDRVIHPLHAHREAFSGFRIAIPNPGAMALLFDKERTRQLCSDLGIPVASGARLSEAATTEQLAARFGLPLVIKPRSSYWLDRLDTLGRARIVDTKPELEQALSGLEEPSRFLVESFFEGVGVGVSVLADEGEILQVFQHRRLRQGRSAASSFRVSEAVDEGLYRACARICGHTKLTGVCMFEFRFNPLDQSWILLETNARFWGSSALPISLGVDFPRFLYDLLVNDIRHSRIGYPPGVRSRNFVLDGFNLLSGPRGRRLRDLGAWAADLGDFALQPMRWASGQERSDSFVQDDFWPALWECATLWTSAGEKLMRPRRRGTDQITTGASAASHWTVAKELR